MKPVRQLVFFVLAAAVFASCNKVTYRKTAGGMPYKLYSGKDTQKIYAGNVVKYNVIYKIGDSVYFSSYGKMPAYAPVNETSQPYDISELWTKLKVGDSIITTQMMDTLLKRNPQNDNGQFKKGDRLMTYIKIIKVFAADSLARKDYDNEMISYGPKMRKEQEEQMAKEEKERIEKRLKEELEAEQSGEAAKEIKEMEDYLSAKKITAQKMGKGTFVFVKEKGNGPAATAGKFVTVKYTGKYFRNDSVFQSSSYTFQLGKNIVISGWDEGLPAFNQGGKGTLYIPGYRAYGKTPPPNAPFKPYDALVFDVEMQNVSDTMPSQTPLRKPVVSGNKGQ